MFNEYNLAALIFVTAGIIVSILVHLSLAHTFDKRSKKHRHDSYQLGKLKYFFVYSKRKQGEISKWIFWLQVLLYLQAIVFVAIWIPMVISQSILLLRILGLIIAIPAFFSYAGLFTGGSIFQPRDTPAGIKEEEEEERRKLEAKYPPPPPTSLTKIAEEIKIGEPIFKESDSASPWDKYK